MKATSTFNYDKVTGIRHVLLTKRTLKLEKNMYKVTVSEIKRRLDKTVILETRWTEDMSLILMVTPQSPHLSPNQESTVNRTDDLNYSEEETADPRNCWNIWHLQGCYLRNETMLMGGPAVHVGIDCGSSAKGWAAYLRSVTSQAKPRLLFQGWEPNSNLEGIPCQNSLESQPSWSEETSLIIQLRFREIIS